MTAIIIPAAALAPLQVRRWIRNGAQPVVDLQNALSTAVGYAVSVRPKPIFRAFGALATGSGDSLIPDSLATRNRWRFAWRAGPFAALLSVSFELAPETSGPTDPYVRLDVRIAGSSTVVGQAERHFGASNGGFADVPLNFAGGKTLVRDVTTLLPLAIVPGAEYEAVFVDVGHGRLHSASVWELALTPTTDNGYPWNARSAGEPIYGAHRAADFAMARAEWAGRSMPLANWHSHLDSAARSNAGALKNFVDDSSTAVSANTPGVTLDMRRRSTLQRAAAGVPVKLKVAGRSTVADDTGVVSLLDADGTALLTVPVTGTTERWYEATGHLPVTKAKYDLHYGGASSGSLVVFAASLYEYDGYGGAVTAAAEGPASMRGRAFDATTSSS